MIKLISKITGCEMWVAEDRAPEYILAGNKPAVEVPPAPPLPKKKPATKKATSQKGTTKK